MEHAPYKELSDEELMQKFCEGDANAFDEIYSRYAGRLLGFLKRRISDGRLAEDVFQETLMKFIQNRHKFRVELPFAPWLFTLCRNVMIDALRKRHRVNETELSEQPLPSALLETATPALSGGYENYLVGLDQRAKKILELHFIQDMPFEAVAKELGMSSTNVRQIASRTVKKLRNYWKPK